MLVSTVVAIVVVPLAILDFTTLPVAPVSSVILIGAGLIPVDPAKRSIVSWRIIASSTPVLDESIPLRTTRSVPEATAISCSNFPSASVPSASVPSSLIILLSPVSSSNTEPPSSV